MKYDYTISSKYVCAKFAHLCFGLFECYQVKMIGVWNSIKISNINIDISITIFD